MKLELLPVYRNLDEYIEKVQQPGADCRSLWDEYAITPYWDRLSRWAPFDLSDRKPGPLKDFQILKRQISMLNKIDLDELRNKFISIMNILPLEDDEELTVALYPLDDGNLIAKERQNGVAGTGIFGNMIININPLADDYMGWIPYVFAHEYHHSVWGNYWYVENGSLTGQFIESMINEGQADSFASSLFPALKPQWLNQISDDKEKMLWEKHYKNMIYQTDVDYSRYMFGDEEAEIPWCAGYFYGYRIVQNFIEQHPEVNFAQLLKVNVQNILKGSGYSTL